MSDTNDKSPPSPLSSKLSLRREKIKVLRVRTELRTGDPPECKLGTCANNSQMISCTSMSFNTIRNQG
jgi:hypothetical protein